VSPLWLQTRRRWLLTAAASLALPASLPAPLRAQEVDTVRRGRALVFPRDHGAHLAARTEWWYATGWLGTETQAVAGFQLTFFRSLTGLAKDSRSRFAGRHLLFAHAAWTQLQPGRAASQVQGQAQEQAGHWHDQAIVRWSGASNAVLGHASEQDGQVQLGPWRLRRYADTWRLDVPARGFKLAMSLKASQSILLQGDAGFSRKGPQEAQASHYYSEPQLLARTDDGQTGRAWMDHEWSNQLLHPDAVGWDWIGINLFDGSALTAFVLRRRDGSALWAGGSWRLAGGTAQSFDQTQVRFTPLRRWLSPASAAHYPVHWRVETPAGTFEVRSLMDAQELDSRNSTGTIYWEGLSELLNAQGQRVGLGYLEMTGYAAPLRLG
jgi:predicted secreted hydrolase